LVLTPCRADALLLKAFCAHKRILSATLILMLPTHATNGISRHRRAFAFLLIGAAFPTAESGSPDESQSSIQNTTQLRRSSNGYSFNFTGKDQQGNV